VSKTNVEVEAVDKSLVVRALDGLGAGLVLTNAQGRVTWVNRAAQRLLGLDPDASRGRPLQSLLQDGKLAEFWRGAVTSREASSGDLAIATPRAAHLRASAASAQDPSGQLLGHALLFCEAPAAAAPPERAERPAGSAPEGLTPQEQKVLQLVGEGLSNRQIAEKMQVAPSTVRSHLKHLYSKLGLRSRSEAVAYALRNPAAAS
jgi:DNA-binding CsgD family transcriptional regulator